MELGPALEVYEALYGELNGYRLSHAERERLATDDRSLTYGEVVGEEFGKVLLEAGIPPGATFCDLGSGTGKAVFLAAMLLPIERGIGVELLPALGDAARGVLERYDREFRPTLPEEQQRQELEFLDEDLADADLRYVDFVYVNASAFQPPLLQILTRKLEELRPGVRAMVLGMPLVAPYLLIERFIPLTMDWGVAPATFYRRA